MVRAYDSQSEYSWIDSASLIQCHTKLQSISDKKTVYLPDDLYWIRNLAAHFALVEVARLRSSVIAVTYQEKAHIRTLYDD